MLFCTLTKQLDAASHAVLLCQVDAAYITASGSPLLYAMAPTGRWRRSADLPEILMPD